MADTVLAGVSTPSESMMFCAGRLLAEGTFESHHVQVVFTGGTHISPVFGGGVVVVGGVQSPFTIVLGDWQVGGGGGGVVHTPWTSVCGAVQVGGVVTGGVQLPFTSLLGGLQAGGVVTGGVHLPFTNVLGGLQVGAGEPGSVPVPIKAISVESKFLLRLRLLLLETKLTSREFLTIPLERGAKVTLRVTLAPGFKESGRLGPLTSNDRP